MTTHTLKSDGAPYDAEANPLFAIPAKGKPSTAGAGAAVCSCGWLSDVLSSRAARIAAHRIHKMSPGDHAGQPTEPDSPAEVENTQEENMTEKTDVKKDTTPIEFQHGAVYFFPVMGESAIKLAENAGLSAELDNRTRTVQVSGGTKRDRDKLVKTVTAFWETQYAAFKEWKKETKEQRREWYKSKEGRAEMTAAEADWFAKYTSAALSDVL